MCQVYDESKYRLQSSEIWQLIEEKEETDSLNIVSTFITIILFQNNAAF